LLFVHRVDGLAPGLYCLVREPAALSLLRAACREGFHWRQPPGIDAALPLYLLWETDCRNVATRVSCDQAIGGDGFFSLGMIARFGDFIEHHGAACYRRLFWETGLIGQVLYLEAEAAGARSTGIGCFYDDSVHEVLGLRDAAFQSLYHFTVGVPVEDQRLTTLPAYEESP
jgi:hypothetical protein